MHWAKIRIVTILVMALFVAKIAMPSPQQNSKALTNTDIIKMTKAGLAESTILAVIQASPANFDVTPEALIAMKTAGVTQNVISAVVAAATNKSGSSTTSPAGAAASSMPTPAQVPGSQTWPQVAGQAKTPNPSPASNQASAVPPGFTANTSTTPPLAASATSPTNEPFVVMLPARASLGSADSISLPLEKTQLSQTKTKASSLGGLANDSVTTQALQTGVNTVAWEGMMHSGGSIAGGVAASEAGGLFGLAMLHRKPTVTYLWAVQGASSATRANSNQPRFSVNFAGWIYVTLADFEPVIVKLTPTPPPNVWRLVGASQGKEDAYSSSSVDWQAFSNFVQDPAPTQVKKISPGIFEISASIPLEAGEYGIVLRPISKTMKFAGADVARNQGNGKVFNSAWTFEVK
jgi:hypothetical protein